jgi:hypothetical protein
LAGFSGQRACDRRLKILIDTGYIERKMILYGVPGVYYLTHKGKVLIGASKRPSKIRVEKISHDIAVLDTVIYFMKKYGVKSENIVTEKQLYSKSGFVTRKHYPDFVFTDASKKDCVCCVEVELTAKAKGKFEKNVEDNYLEYKTQYWAVPKSELKIRERLKELGEKYSNIETMELEGVQEYVRDNNKGSQSE